MCNKYDLAWTLVRNTSRKIHELNSDMSYQNAAVFANMLKTQMASNRNHVFEKLIQLKNDFELLNHGSKRMLEFLKLDDKFISDLSQPIKKGTVTIN